MLRKEIVDEEVTLKNPSEAVEEVEILAEEFYNKPLILEKGKHVMLGTLFEREQEGVPSIVV